MDTTGNKKYQRSKPGGLKMPLLQCYDKDLEALQHPQEYKIRKILEYGSLQKINNDCYICRPIIGYNKTTYTLMRGISGAWRCDCQGYHKRGSCSHAAALSIMLKDSGQEKQGVLF